MLTRQATMYVMPEQKEVFNLASIDGVTLLRLHVEEGRHRPYRAVVVAPGVRAEATISLHRAGFARYFSDLAANWHGWSGTRDFTAHAPAVDYGMPSLLLSATADSLGHITMTIKVGVPAYEQAPLDWREVRDGKIGQWTVHVVLMIEAGQLEEIAKQAHHLPHDSTTMW